MSESSPPHRIIVTGATSIVGQFLLPKLAYAGYEVHAISRKDSSNPAMIQKNIFWHSGDISYPKQVPCPSAIALVHLAPLWLLPPLLPVLDSLQVRRVIGFSSTSIFSKARSSNLDERRVAASLAAARASSRLEGCRRAK